MVDGPILSEREIFDRLVAVFQTFEPSERRDLYRRAIVFEQRPPTLTLDGQNPAYLVWFVEADSREGNSWQTYGFESRASADTAAASWLGTDRSVGLDKVSHGALTVVMSKIQRLAWR